VRKLVEQNTIITGGSIVSMLLGETVQDFDIYFKTPETALAVANYYVEKLKANPPAAFEEVKDKIKVIMEPAIADGETVVRTGDLHTKGPQPPRVRVVVGNRALGHHQDYHLRSEGEVTDNTEPTDGASYEGNTEALDDHSPDTLTDKEDEKKRGKYRPLFITANAITLSSQVQIVLRFQGDVGQIHENFDFTHATNSWTSWDRKLVLRPEALECILSRELRYQGSKYPIASLIRTRKFITRGWTVNAGQFVKMAYQVAQLDLNDPSVLEDQLVGVDSAYFSMLIRSLNDEMQKRIEADPSVARSIDGNRLITLIDKIF
jgi:hypothetical protein